MKNADLSLITPFCLAMIHAIAFAITGDADFYIIASIFIASSSLFQHSELDQRAGRSQRLQDYH